MFRAVRQVIIYIPETALQLDIIYELLNVSAFWPPSGRNSAKKLT